MRCPVCGSKMVDGRVCQYCNITSQQVLSASNEAAKKAFKNGDRQEVCYTTKLPNDVNKKKLVLLTVFLGWFGAGNFYVGKKIKGYFCAFSISLTFISGLFYELTKRDVLGGAEFYYGIFSFFTFFLMINILMWFTDILNLMFNNYKVPVILGGAKNKSKHHSIKK